MPIPGGPFYTASKHAILGIMRSLHLPLVFAWALSIASSPVWNSRYQYVLSLTILYRYRYRPSSGRWFWRESHSHQYHTSQGPFFMLPWIRILRRTMMVHVWSRTRRLQDDGWSSECPSWPGTYWVTWCEKWHNWQSLLLRVTQRSAHYYCVCQDLWQLLGRQVVVWSIGAAPAKLMWDFIASVAWS